MSLDIIYKSLLLVDSGSVVLGLSTLVSSAVLLLLTSLRETYETSPEKKTILGETFVGVLDATLETTASREIFSSSLQVCYF